MKPFLTELNGKIFKQIWLAVKLGGLYKITKILDVDTAQLLNK
jgi:hypothetical protein